MKQCYKCGGKLEGGAHLLEDGEHFQCARCYGTAWRRGWEEDQAYLSVWALLGGLVSLGIGLLVIIGAVLTILQGS